MKKLLFTFLVVIAATKCFSQNSKRLDSLLQVSKTTQGYDLVHILNEISWEFKNSQSDSSLVYAKQALRVANSIQNKKAIASAFNSIASAFEVVSSYDSSLVYHNKSLEIKREINDTIGIANTYNNLGIIYDTKGNYTEALKSYFKALKIYDQHSDEFQKVPMVYVNIGIVYKKQKEYEKVLDYYSKALKIYQENNYSVGEVITTGNIGSLLIDMERYNEAISYLSKAKKLYSELGYQRYVPYMEVNMAIAKDSLKQYKQAEDLYSKSIKSFVADNNMYELSNAKVSLANNYIKNRKHLKAKVQLDEALKITQENNFKEIEIKALKCLAEVEAVTGNYKKAFNSFKRYAIQKDSVFESDKTKTIFELETKYETEKKEKEILTQRTNIAEKELALSQKNAFIIGLIVLAAVLGILGYLFYNQQKLKNRQLQKENELKDALLVIETQNRLQEQRLRISRDLHDNIGAQLTFIISSLDNLKYGFKLPEKLGNKLKSISDFATTTIYELRDTIWAMNKNEITFEDLQTRISNFIDKAKISSENITFNFKVEDDVEESFTFSSVQGMNVYRIIQEAINNAIKYAEPKNIEVSIAKENADLAIAIHDDGKGFDAKNIELGNGLNNMKKRALDLKAEFLIDSKINEGTSVQLLIPKNT